MNTGQLIDALSADVPPLTRAPLGKIMSAVMALAAVVAVCVMLATVGPRPHIEQAPVGFLLLKLLFPTAMAAIGGYVLFNAMRPGQDVSRWSPYVWLPMAFVGVAGVFALVIQPMSQWDDMILGTNWAMCLACIPLFAMLPIEIRVKGVVQEHAPNVEKGRSERHPQECSNISSASQQPPREAVGPNGWQV